MKAHEVLDDRVLPTHKVFWYHAVSMAKDKGKFKQERIAGSLAARVVLICLALLIIPLIIHTFYFYNRNYKERLTDTIQEVALLGQGARAEFSEWILLYTELIYDMTTDPSITSEDMVRISKNYQMGALFEVVRRSEDQFICIKASKPERIGEISPFYQHLLQVHVNHPVVFAAYDTITGTNQIFIAAAIDEHKILVIGKYASRWMDRFAGAFKEYFYYWLTLVDNQGHVLATNDPYFALKGSEVFKLDDMPKKLGDLVKSKKDFFNLEVSFENTNFTLFVGFARRALVRQLFSEMLTRLFFFGFFVFVVGGGLVWLLVKKMTQPLQELFASMQCVGQGDLGRSYRRQRWGFEINKVGGFFNQTVESLIAHQKAAEEERLKSETYQKELQIAREIQKSLFPKEIPAFVSLEIATGFLPAKTVSGDFYDLFPLGDKLMIVVADASGKGVSSALYSLSVRSLLRSGLSEQVPFADMVDRTNELFCLDTQESGSFVTAWIGLYDRKTKLLQYTSCGHNPTFLRKADGSLQEITTRGMALGVSPEEKASVHEVELEKGDFLLCYTDGLVEAQNPDGQFYGKGRVLQLLEQHKKGAEDLLDRLLYELSSFTQGAEQFDDITLVAIQLVPT